MEFLLFGALVYYSIKFVDKACARLEQKKYETARQRIINSSNHWSKYD